jgi:hypothetical protein
MMHQGPLWAGLDRGTSLCKMLLNIALTAGSCRQCFTWQSFADQQATLVDERKKNAHRCSSLHFPLFPLNVENGV